MTTPSSLSVPLFLLTQDSLYRPEKEGRCEAEGRGTAASTDAGRKGAFWSVLENGRDPLRLLVKSCSACGFNLNIQGYENCSLYNPTHLLIRGDSAESKGRWRLGVPKGGRCVCFRE